MKRIQTNYAVPVLCTVLLFGISEYKNAVSVTSVSVYQDEIAEDYRLYGITKMAEDYALAEADVISEGTAWQEMSEILGIWEMPAYAEMAEISELTELSELEQVLIHYDFDCVECIGYVKELTEWEAD